MRYRVEAAPGVRILPRNYPTNTPLITPYFQRAGDSWTGRGAFETYRWYGSFASQALRQGEFQIIAPLNGNWTAIHTSTAHSARSAFRQAATNADQVGFVLGGGDGYGHGVYATGPARLVVTHFRVE